MTIIAFTLCASERGVPAWIFAVAMLCDTTMASVAMLSGKLGH